MDNCEEASCVTATEAAAGVSPRGVSLAGGFRHEVSSERRGLPHSMVFAVGCGARSAKEGHLVDALALRGDEGRGTLRKARGRCERSLIPGSPNGATHPQGYPDLNP